MTALVPLKKEFQFTICAECSPTWAHVNKDGNTELIKIFLSQVGMQVSLLCNVEHKLMLTEEQRTKTRRTSCLLQSRGATDKNYGLPEWAQTWKWAGSRSQTQRNHSKTHVGQTHSVKQRWAHKKVKPQVSDISLNPDGSVKHLLYYDTPGWNFQVHYFYSYASKLEFNW